MTEEPLHIRLLNLMSAIRAMSPFGALTADEEQLLRSLLVRWHEPRDISVGEVMRGMTEVSEATAYRRIMSLRDKGLITLRAHQSDKRVKLIDPAPLALEYSEQVGAALEELMEQRPAR